MTTFRTARPRHRSRRVIAFVLLSLVLASLMVAVPTPDSAEAANGSDFRPGNIIDDATFFDPNTMTVSQIQSFLNAKVPTCATGYTCLKSYRQDTATQAADPMCAQYAGATNESAATIIYKAAKACSINPKVILVTLQKEQGLVTKTAPTSQNFRAATGSGCPDTGPCDAADYGFFYQVYRAAWRFQRYTMPAGTGAGTAWYSNYSKYGAGKTVAVQYHPNTDCGTKSVFIENKATGSLYTYTPYTPNTAALSVGYGTGDSCSAYGNRNFFYYYTDWFGSTQGTGSMIRADGTSAVYLVYGATKYLVPNQAILSIFSALGPTRVVSAAYLGTFATGVNLSPAVRDPQTGVVALVQGGKRHRIDSCTRASAWGYPCGTYASISPSQALLLPLAEELTDYHLLPGSTTIYKLAGTVDSPVDGAGYAATLNGGTAPYTAVMTAEAAAKLSKGALLMSPPAAVGTVIKKYGEPEAFFVDGARKIPAPALGVADAFGANVPATLSPTRVDGYPTAVAPLTHMASCNAVPYFGAGGTLFRIDPAAKHGLGVTALDPATCTALTKSDAAVAKAIWIRDASASQIYEVIDGKRRLVPDKATFDARRGGTSPASLAIGTRQLATIPLGEALRSVTDPPPATLVKQSGRSEIWFIDGILRKIHLPSWGVGDALGLSTYKTVGADIIDRYPAASGSLSQMVACAGVPYFGAAGTLYRIDPAAKHGLGVTTLQTTTCAALKRSAAPVAKAIWIRAVSTSNIYEVIDGKRRLVPDKATFDARRGGTSPASLVISARQLGTIPLGTPLPSQGE